MKTRKNLFTRLLALILISALCLSLLGCQAQEPDVAPETENLVKLCKVWGYTKYMHPAFLLGKKDWDEELLNLIPQVREAGSAEEVNELLHNWFVSLGEIDYESRVPVVNWVTAAEDEIAVIADTSWTTDAAYLGESLTADFALFPEALPKVDRERAPVFFDRVGRPDLSNEPEHDTVYTDPALRLLGLFRLWNAAEYHFPYQHLMDRDWEECLEEAIPGMLEGTDQESYEMSIATLAFQLQDAHVVLFDTDGQLIRNRYLGDYRFPVPLLEADGVPVVSGSADGCPLEAGDILVSVNGKSVDVLDQEFRRYECMPREDLHAYAPMTRSKTEEMTVTVLRDGEALTFSLKGVLSSGGDSQEAVPYKIVEGNIGLINPEQITESGMTHEAMDALRDTEALIVDLRQYPGSGDFSLLYYYMPEIQPGIIFAIPSPAAPGAYVKTEQQYGYYPALEKSGFYAYDKPVVVLMSDKSMSFSETAITVLGTRENVVVIGSNSVGANGDATFLPLPGEIMVSFSSFGAYNVDGTQSQRVGITPDILVEPTIQGIKEGRDEVLEAAIEYIKTGGVQ